MSTVYTLVFYQFSYMTVDKCLPGIGAVYTLMVVRFPEKNVEWLLGNNNL